MENIWKDAGRQIKRLLLQHVKDDGGLNKSSGDINRKMQTDSRNMVKIEMTEPSHDDSEVIGFHNTVDSSANY